MTTPRTNASHDQNFQPTIMGVSSADGTTPVPIEVDPSTGAMLTSGGGGGGGTVTQGTAAAVTAGWPVIGGELPDTTGTFTNATQTTSVTTSSFDGYSTVIVSINGTYGTASAVFETSDDSGTTWYSVNAARTDGTGVEVGYTSLTNISRMWTLSVSGADEFRVRSTAVASGTVNVRISIESMPTPEAASVNAFITNGTNAADVVAGDTGFNGVAVASAGKSFTFTSSGSGAQVIGPFNAQGFSYVKVHILVNSTSGLVQTGQFSQTTGGTFNTAVTFLSVSSSVGTQGVLGSGVGNWYISPVIDNWFQINITALTSGTISGTITFSNQPFAPGSVVAAQTGIWTVGSNSATGSVTPANAHLIGMADTTNLNAFQSINKSGKTGATGGGLAAFANYISNGTTHDEMVSALAAVATTGTGLLGVGNLAFDSTNWQPFRVGIGSDAYAAALGLNTVNGLFNGTTYDRNRNNTTAAVIAAGATTTQTSSTITTYNASKLVVVINVSAFTSGTLTFTVNGITSSGYTYPILVSTALGATGVTPLRIFPGSTPSANAVANDMVPRSFNVVVTGTFSATYGADYELGV